MLGGISICLRKHDPSAGMMIYIFIEHMLQLQPQSIIICPINVTLTAKSEVHILQFPRIMNGPLKPAPAVLICLVNITLIAKAALHVSHFARRMAAALYHNAVELEKF